MNTLIKKYNIKIPQDTFIIYSKKRRVLSVSGPFKTKSIKLKVQIFIEKSKKSINVSPLVFSQTSNAEKKNIQTLRSTTVAKIKYMLIESSILIYKKLKINGVGYRTNFTENFNKNLLTFKLGYSHFVYVQTLKNLTITCVTKTKFCIFGSSYESVSQFAARIRSSKKPEPYKGKGLLYSDEKVERKEGKKI